MRGAAMNPALLYAPARPLARAQDALQIYAENAPIHTVGCMSSPSCETMRISLLGFRCWHAFRVQIWPKPSRFPSPPASSPFCSDPYACHRGCVIRISTRFRERFPVVSLPFSMCFGRYHCPTTDSSRNAPSPLPPHPCYIQATAQRQFSTDNRHDFQGEYGSATSIRNAIRVFPDPLPAPSFLVHSHLACGACATNPKPLGYFNVSTGIHYPRN